MGPIRRACLDTFIEKGHEFVLYTYDAVSDIPAEITQRDANEIIDYSDIFYYRNPFSGEACDLGPFSDLFRFKLLSQEGGWWSDVDTLCLSESIGEPDYAWAQEQPEKNQAAIGTSQIAMPAGSSIANTLYHECLKLSRTDFQPREALGPHLLSRVVSSLQLEKNRYGEANLFYPVRWIEMFKLWLPEYHNEAMEKAAKAYFMPIYQSYPKYLGLDVLGLPPKDSYLYAILQKGCHIQKDSNINFYDAAIIRDKVREFFKRNKDWAPQELDAVAGRPCRDKLLSDS